MFRLATSSALFLIAMAAPQSPLKGQQALEPTATFPEPFSQVVGIRQLSDGRLIIADRLEKHVSYLDFARGTLRQISREGEGPGEYQSPLGLIAFPNDATLLVDLGNMRMSLIDDNGAINESWPMMRQGDNGMMRFIRPQGSDANGNIYYSTAGVIMRGPGGASTTPSDSGYLLRLHLETNELDTVATLFSEPINSSGSQSISISGGGARVSGLSRRPFRVQDDWSVAPDGHIAIVRASNYRIDWVDGDGRLTVGTPQQYNRVRIGQPEKEAWADRTSGASMSFVVGGGAAGSGGSTISVPPPDLDEVEFPEFMPPFGNNAVNVSPRGDVWVQLNRPAGDPEPLFDIFASDGRKIGQIELASGRRLVGFGTDTFYAVAVDEDDLQWLEEYAYPR